MTTKMGVAVAVVVIALAVTGGNAFAKGGACDESKGDGRGKWSDSITKDLNLTAEQKTGLEAQKKAHRDSMKTMRETVMQAHRELRDAIAKPEATRQQVEPIVARIKGLEADMTDKRVEGIFAVKAILTPEQFAKLETLKEKKMSEMKKRHKGKCDDKE